MTPLVSIVMPAYNSASYIRQAIDSCLAQTHQAIELIVIDDGSSDDTVAIVQSYGDAIRLIQQSNQGPAIARNTGITNASGAFIQFCDSDDVLHPEKVARSLSVLQAHPDVALIYTLMQAISDDGAVITERDPEPLEHYFETTSLFCKILNHIGSPLQTSTLLVRKSALEAVGMYRANVDQRCAEDWDLLLRLADQYPIVGIHDVLTYYRVRSDSLSRDALLMAQGRLQTTQYARDYPSRRACHSDEAYNQFEAGRWHQLAMIHWRNGDASSARRYFSKAIGLTSQGRIGRVMAILASIILSSQHYESLMARRATS
ncbi:MAG: glycosyltransferase family A protein [Chloroflexota bacterium]